MVRFLSVAVCCFALTLALLPAIEAQPTHLWIYEKYGGYIRLPTFSMPNAQVTYENTTEGFEFNITLSKKPAGSAFKVNIESGGWNWYYQPPLDQELNVSEYTFVNATHAMNGTTILAFRPENVVGSYAVYGNSNYSGTGKVFHLYRPLLIAANGARLWASLNVSQGILTVSANATWLNTAAYPVVIDPTFGYTSVGSSSAFIDSANPDRKQGCKFAMSENGVASSIKWYGVSFSTNNPSHLCIYSDDSGSPNSLLGYGSFTMTTSAGWFEVSGLSVELDNGVTYWLAVHNDGEAGSYYYDSGDSNQCVSDDTWDSDAPSSTWSSSKTFSDRKMSIYVTYEEEAGDSYTLVLTVTSPINDTYDETIPVSLSTSGNDTNPVYSWNVKFANSSWFYVSNKTSTSYTMEIYENQTNCLFACTVIGDNSAYDYEQIYFSVEYITSKNATENYVWAAVLLAMGLTFFLVIVMRRNS